METKSETATWVAEVQHKFTNDRALICAALRKTEAEMFWFRWNAGMKFLRVQCSNDAWGIEMLKHERFYWQWFINQWELRDLAFIYTHELHLCNPKELTADRIEGLLLAYEYKHANSFTTEVMVTGYQQVLSQAIELEIKADKKPAKKHTYEHFLIK